MELKDYQTVRKLVLDIMSNGHFFFINDTKQKDYFPSA